MRHSWNSCPRAGVARMEAIREEEMVDQGSVKRLLVSVT